MENTTVLREAEEMVPCGSSKLCHGVLCLTGTRLSIWRENRTGRCT